ncbi:MAG: hypothetical protein FWH12_04895 [Treponema sp.]|nr:hypothetical protein [Treponema sp.]
MGSLGIKPDGALFLFLVPQEETIKALEDYRRSLFSQALLGARSLPPGAILAQLGEALGPGDLKALAQKIREATIMNEGWIGSGVLVRCPLGLKLPSPAWEGLSLFGPALNLDLRIKEICGSPVLLEYPPLLSAAILCPDEANPPPGSPETPVFAFRTAALTLLRIHPLGKGRSYSFEWQMDRLYFMPPYRRPKHKALGA